MLERSTFNKLLNNIISDMVSKIVLIIVMLLSKIECQYKYECNGNVVFSGGYNLCAKLKIWNKYYD